MLAMLILIACGGPEVPAEAVYIPMEACVVNFGPERPIEDLQRDFQTCLELHEGQLLHQK